MAHSSVARRDELSRAEKVITFIERYLVVPEGAHVGRKVELRPWQREIIEGIYGSPTRRAIISMGRKNAKTTLTAMLLLAHLVGPEALPNAQIYSAAQSRDQAALVFNLAAKMVRMSPGLLQHVTVRDTAKELFCTLTGVRYRALSADATTAYGLSPVLVIHDELGQVKGPRSELYDALETSMGAQAWPLSVILSTQAPTDADLLSTLIDDAARGSDPQSKLFLFAADRDDDPYVEATWRKANPALGDFRSLPELAEAAERAKRMPAFEASFRNLYLNQRVAAKDHFLTPSVWKLNEGAPDLAAFDDLPVFGGLDLSGRNDLTALVLVAPDPTGIYHVLPHFWAPEGGLRDRAERDRAPYDVWRDQGLLTATPGQTVDYDWVAARLGEIKARCDLRLVKYDRWRIDDLKRDLAKAGVDIPLEPHGQGFKDMSPALEALEGLALNGRLRHGANPILTWCAANCVVVADPAGNRKLDKSKATGRIDGMVALAMAVSAAGMAPEPAGSSLSTPGAIEAFFG